MSKAKPRIQKRLESSDRVSEVGVGFSKPSFASDNDVQYKRSIPLISIHLHFADHYTKFIMHGEQNIISKFKKSNHLSVLI